jgi:hypothetical protein
VGTLDKIAVESDHDEQRMRNVLTTTLRLDLVQDYGREADKRAPEYSLNNIPESKLAPIEMNSGVSEREWLRKFPHLAARVLYGMTEDDMATAEEVSRSTIARRIATEKRQFLVEYITKGGLVVEGDETIPELQEAYGHLKAAGR